MKNYLQEILRDTKYIFSGPSSTQSSVPYDIVFILPPKGSDGWILAGLCKEIASRLPGYLRFRLINFGEKLPLAKWYFFSHYMFYIRSKRNIPESKIFRGSCVFFTHMEADKHNISDNQVFSELDQAHHVICMNSASQKLLTKKLKDPMKIKLVIGAADHTHFVPALHKAGNYIGFSANYYERKNPNLMFEIIKILQEEQFLLIGNHWDKCNIFQQMLSLKNFRYVSPAYKDYPVYYHMMRALISTSTLEGGPIPLIEAMMTNVPALATRTGFTEDVIIHGGNGYIFDIDSSAEQVIFLIKKLGELKADTRSTVLQYSWDNFCNNIIELFEL